MEALRGTSSGVRLQDEIEMLVCNIELTTHSMNKLPGIRGDILVPFLLLFSFKSYWSKIAFFN